MYCCFSSVVERILGKDEVPSSTLGSSSKENRKLNVNKLTILFNIIKTTLWQKKNSNVPNRM